MIRTTNLVKVYRTEEVETTALHNVNINIRESEFVAILGPSGCGKSTLLNVLGMLDDYDSGNYSLFGDEISACSGSKKADIRKRRIGFVFQSFNLIDELTVFENIELPLKYLRIPSKERKHRAENLLDRMKITSRRNHFPRQLSGGQQQRVAVARAVVAEPELILADEPTGNLDSEHGSEVINLLVDLNREGTAVLMVTHSKEYAHRADRIIYMLDGHIVNGNHPGGGDDK